MCVLYPPSAPAVQSTLPRSVVRQLDSARALAREGHELSAFTVYRQAVPMLSGVCPLLKRAVQDWRAAYIRLELARERAEARLINAQLRREAWFARYDDLIDAENELAAWSVASSHENVAFRRDVAWFSRLAAVIILGVVPGVLRSVLGVIA